MHLQPEYLYEFQNEKNYQCLLQNYMKDFFLENEKLYFLIDDFVTEHLLNILIDTVVKDNIKNLLIHLNTN